MTEVPRTSPEFVTWLVSRHPEIGPLLEEHLTGYSELLPHVLFGDVTRYAADLARRAAEEPEADAELLGLLEDLDRAMLPEGDDDDPVDNLVWVSFVENTQGVAGDAEEPLRDRMHSFPNLARALSHYE
jgi:hypothetical protein